MGVFIALYRGINVSGKNMVKMDALRAFHEQLGHRDVKTYIQSGNVLFSARGTAEGIGRKVATRFAEEFGFEPRVLVVERERWGQIVTGNPYAQQAVGSPTSVHAAICDGQPSAVGLHALLAKAGGREVFEVKDRVIYLHAPDGFGTSKFAAGMEKASGVPMTVRNWRTVETLWTLANGKA